MEFEVESAKQDKDWHYVVFKDRVYEKDIIKNVYAPSIRMIRYVNQNY